jgi:hypothetical protein
LPEELPEYSFLPWSRRGIATRVDQVDNLGAAPADGPKDRATLSASLTLESVPVPGAPALADALITQSVALVGPGDVKGLRPGTVLRAVPVPGSVEANPGELAYVEFYDEELPWRYTPAKATTDHRLRPWLALLVLADGEYTLTPVPGEPAVLTVVDAAPLPLVTETWAWAHVQASGDLGAGDAGDLLESRVSSTPDLALSRLLSPRRLDRQTGYHAFVVPAFESGRLAGLGTPADPGTVPAQQPAWDQGQPRVLPVLFDWAFRTGDLADFEVLARRPQAYRIETEDGFGAREMDISDPGGGVEIPSGTTVGFEGALAPVDFDGRAEFPQTPGAQVVNRLASVVDRPVELRESGVPSDDAGEDPVVAPPAYARQHAGLDRVVDSIASSQRWLAELNLDPRNRATAGLGAEIVRQRDEELMERAWSQVEELDAVNQRLREGDLALATSERIFAKNIARTGPDRMLGLTAAAHSALRAPAAGGVTVRGEVDASRVPAAAQAPAFRRITRPTRPLVRALTQKTAAAGLQDGLVGRLNLDPRLAVSTAPPAPDPTISVDESLVVTAAQAVAAQVPRGRDVLPVLADELVRAMLQAGTLTASTTVGSLKQPLKDLLDARYPDVPVNQALRTEAKALIDALSRVTAGNTVDTPTVLSLPSDDFTDHYGSTIDGKAHQAVVIGRESAALTSVAATASPTNALEFAAALGDFSVLAASRPAPPPAAPLTEPDLLATRVAGQLRPLVAMPARLASVLDGPDDLTVDLANRHRLKPVMDYPTFEDPLFEPLRLLSQDYIIPNVTSLPSESIALMVPNVRFIESLLAGVNTELARELLWNEFPTDQRGTYFARFFDASDAGVDRPPDIPEVHGWKADLGSNSPQLTGLLVLVVRAALLVKFPDAIVFAQRGRYTSTAPEAPRTLDLGGEVRHPVVHGRLEPDIALFGFEMTPEEAAGDATNAGFFFCFTERPGQLRFGLDLDEDPVAPRPALDSWDSLAWKHLEPQDGALPDQVLVTENQTLVPTGTGQPAWGATSAHLASILCQNPVWLARHATDMLPVEGEGPR